MLSEYHCWTQAVLHVFTSSSMHYTTYLQVVDKNVDKNVKTAMLMWGNLKAVLDKITYRSVIILHHKVGLPPGLVILFFPKWISGHRDNLISAHRRWEIETLSKLNSLTHKSKLLSPAVAHFWLFGLSNY